MRPVPHNSRRFSVRLTFLAVVAQVACSALSGWSLDHQQTKAVALRLVQQHLLWEQFDDKLSQRTLERMLDALDPEKLCFLKADVERLTEDYGDRIDDLLAADDWSFLEAVAELHDRRLREHAVTVASLIAAKQEAAPDDQYFALRDREYLDTPELLDDRWRREVLYQKVLLYRMLGNQTEVAERLNAYHDRRQHESEVRTVHELCTMFLKAVAGSLGPYSAYLTPLEHDSFQIAMQRHLSGSGTVIGQTFGVTSIKGIVPGGPAEGSGLLKVGDVILAVGQGTGESVDIRGEPLKRIVKLIRGPAGTEVRLSIRRRSGGTWTNGEALITRGDVKLPTARAETVTVRVRAADEEPRELKVGVISLPTFYGSTTRRADGEPGESASADLLRLISELSAEGMQALVLDLRNNGGGLLDEAVKVAGVFLDKGPVVQIRSQNTQVLFDPTEGSAYAGPLVVLVNRRSSSASEIVAAVIQDYGRGLIVGGSHTYGKGTVQNLRAFQDRSIGGAVKVTIAQFFRVNGTTTQFDGVTPDITLPDPPVELSIGERFLDYAAPPTSIKPVDVERLGQVAPHLERLRLASQARVKESPTFQEIARLVEEAEAKEGQPVKVSLAELQSPDESDDDVVLPEDGPKDPYLHECLGITADYVQLLAGRSPGKTAISDGSPVGKAADEVAADKAPESAKP